MQAKITQRNLSKFAAESKPYDVRDTELKGFLLRVHPTGRKVYYCQYARGKREQIGTVPAVTAELARDKARAILAGVMLGVETPDQARRRVQPATLRDFIEETYAPWAEEHRKSGKGTVARLKAIFFGTLGDKPLNEITPGLVDPWRTTRRKEGIAASTINRDVVALRAALSKAIEWGHLESHPLKDLKPLKTDKSGAIVRYLTDAEEKRLRAALKARDRRIIESRQKGNAWRTTRGYELLPALAGPYGDHLTPMVLLSMNTGLRRGELLALTWKDVDFDNKLLTIAGENAKSGHTRRIPLKDRTDGTGLAFRGRSDGPLDNVKKSWAGVLQSAGITEFRWHDLRHHFASRLVMAGADIYVVKDLLGHSTIAITEKYAHLAPEHKQAAVALLDRKRKA
ncbi:MAG: tyrosine-type recombinase/integrase [Gammaproteobacteria bacterium]